MRTLSLTLRLDHLPACDAYRQISSLEDYPTYTDAVRRVEVLEREERRTVSAWEVSFNDGLMRWVEEDHFDPEALRVRFRQTAGDLELFEGEWRIDPLDAGCDVHFSARFDLGVPTLADMLDPIAEDALRENIQRIVAGLRPAGPR